MNGNFKLTRTAGGFVLTSNVLSSDNQPLALKIGKPQP
jgi:hypothetical protein